VEELLTGDEGGGRELFVPHGQPQKEATRWIGEGLGWK
jgi:hypothetical protein